MIKQLWQNVNLGQAHTGVLYTELATFCKFKIISKEKVIKKKSDGILEYLLFGIPPFTHFLLKKTPDVPLNTV